MQLQRPQSAKYICDLIPYCLLQQSAYNYSVGSDCILTYTVSKQW